jgi:hypothetical protein
MNIDSKFWDVAIVALVVAVAIVMIANVVRYAICG